MVELRVLVRWCTVMLPIDMVTTRRDNTFDKRREATGIQNIPCSLYVDLIGSQRLVCTITDDRVRSKMENILRLDSGDPVIDNLWICNIHILIDLKIKCMDFGSQIVQTTNKLFPNKSF